MAMEPRDLNTALLEVFPELAPDFHEYVSWQDGMDTGAFLTYEDVFRSRLEKAIALVDVAFLQRAGAFIEELFTSGDPYAVNVIYVGILEGLKANCDNAAVRSFLGAKSLAEFDALTY